MMSSWSGYPLPLLSYVLSLTVTVKEEMPDAAGMVAEMGKKANVSSKPCPTPCRLLVMAQELEPQSAEPLRSL